MAYMFQDCSSLTELDLSGFDTSKTEDFERMFEGCTGLTELDLSSFNTRRASFMHSMFHLCSNLRTIYVGDDWEMEQSNEDIPADYDWAFLGCVNIRGGAGTVYDPNKTDKEYARIDGLNGLKGYLTAKPVDSVDPDAKLAQKVGNNLSKLIGYLPDAQFFSDIKNLSKAKVTGLSAFIDSIKEGSREVIAILTPMRVSEAGVYFMKLNISPKQAERLKGGRDLRYHVKPCASADVRTAEDGESSDNSHGVLVDEDGEKLTGEYDGGDLHVLTYLDKGNTVYVQFITAEAEPKDSHSPSGGCDAGFSGIAGIQLLAGFAAALPMLLRKRRM